MQDSGELVGRHEDTHVIDRATMGLREFADKAVPSYVIRVLKISLAIRFTRDTIVSYAS